MSDADQLRAHAERVRASGVLSRSQLLQRLFDYLVECSLTGRTPKEIEVAVDVFGKGTRFDVSQDAAVRVYIHKLRRKLDEFYSGRSETERIVIPRGSYRLMLQSADPAPAAEPQAPRPEKRRWLAVALVAGLAVSLALNAVLAMVAHFTPRAPRDELADVRSNPVWSRILTDQRPILIVLGDYYIFGEVDERMDVQRLVREFSINSQHDLERHLKLHPEEEGRYMDLGLGYLPISAGFALREVMPVLGSAAKRARVTTMSALDPAEIKSSHVIYIGYLSGMGMMQDLVFAGSRFSVGDTYDEIVDGQSGKRYVSQSYRPLLADSRYHDYGYFATFAGPSGNQVVIIAGTRDVAVMHTAEVSADAARLRELVQSAGNAQSFEALYEAYGLESTNLDGQLLLTSRLDTARIWADAPRHLTMRVP